MTAPVGKVLQTADQLMTREQRLLPSIDERLQYFLSEQDINNKDSVCRRKALTARRKKLGTVEA